jgi:hypothetical protein
MHRMGAIASSAAAAVYLVVLGYIAWWMFSLRNGVLDWMGLPVLWLMVVGAWAIVASMRFGFQVERLARRLAEEGGLPDTSMLPCRPSGRIEPAAAVAWYDERKAELDAEPTDWRRWYRLARAYDLAGDRRRARDSMRQALRLSARNGDGSRATSAAQGPVTRPAG